MTVQPAIGGANALSKKSQRGTHGEVVIEYLMWKVIGRRLTKHVYAVS